MRHWLVTMDGLDGSGLSTGANLLAERTGALVLKSPPDPFREFRKLIDKGVEDPTARFLYYLSANFHLAYTIRRYLGAGHSVVCDRYVHSTLAFFGAQGVPTEGLAGYLKRYLLMPDLAFLITCRPDIRIARMRARGELSTNDETVLRIGKQYDDEYKKLNGLITIDNSTKDPQVMVEAMLEHINRIKQD